jgi:hypothetical protein
LGEERQGAFILNSIRLMDDKTDVIDLLYENTETEKGHLWLVIYSNVTKKNKIEDLKNPNFD